MLVGGSVIEEPGCLRNALPGGDGGSGEVVTGGCLRDVNIGARFRHVVDEFVRPLELSRRSLLQSRTHTKFDARDYIINSSLFRFLSREQQVLLLTKSKIDSFKHAHCAPVRKWPRRAA